MNKSTRVTMNSPSPKTLVIGTSGHIDHGKTALVRALTGIDTDRLAEEKKRGISIDLGFAHLATAAATLSFIDVPGHERFVKNMLAGVGGIDAVLFVVAADASVQPQTREHFEICRLLGVHHGVIALTKCDLAGESRRIQVISEIRQLVRDSFLANAPVVSVSAHTGAGLAELLAQLEDLANRRADVENGAIPRLWIDRAFAKPGFGAVVTGTLLGGELETGQTVEIFPLRRTVRIRGLQTHGVAVERVAAGQRAAVNLVGVEHAELARGFILTDPGSLEPVTLFDAVLECAGSLGIAPVDLPSRRFSIQLHVGSAEAEASIKVLSTRENRTLVIEPAAPLFARISLCEPLLLAPGDRFIVRRPSPALTLAGGRILDAHPPLRWNREKTLQRLSHLAAGTTADFVRQLIAESAHGRRLQSLSAVTGIPPSRVKEMIAADPTLVFAEQEQRVVTTEWVAAKREQVCAWLTAYHRDHPRQAGASVGLLRQALFPGIEPSFSDRLLRQTPGVRQANDMVALESHSVSHTPAETAALERLEQAYREGGFQPPELSAALALAALDPKRARDLLEALVKQKRLVRVSGDLLFHADVLEHLRKSLAAHRGRRFTVPQFKEWTSVSRKFAIPLLEYLDREHVTRRESDTRVVL
jgi:selenocysteine-specific elongation factor